MKNCIKCHQELLEICFYWRKDSNKYRNECIKCNNNTSNKWHLKNTKKANKRDRIYYSINKKDIWNKRKIQHLKNPQKRKTTQKKSYNKNKEKRNKYQNKRRHNDINLRIIGNLRNRINELFNGITKTSHSKTLLMCSVEDFKKHIESLWLPGMSWDNYGFGPDKWNIDHIIPLVFFKDYILDPVEQYMCFRWQNTQPLWFKDNNFKNDKLLSKHLIKLNKFNA